MIDTNLLNTASNLLVQAGYTIKATPLPADYTALGSGLVNVGLDLIGLAAIVGRIWHGWKNESSVLRGLFLGDNTTKAVLQSRIAPPTTTATTLTK